MKISLFFIIKLCKKLFSFNHDSNLQYDLLYWGGNGLAAAATVPPPRLFTRGAFGKPDKSLYPIPVSVTQNEDRYFYKTTTTYEILTKNLGKKLVCVF